MNLYLVTCTVNAYQYVGKTTKTVEHRWKRHLSQAKSGTTYLHNAIRKYGVESFTVQRIPIESHDDANLNEWERLLIDQLDSKAPNGFNLTEGGDGIAGLIFTEGHRRRLSAAAMGNQKTLGHKHTDETRAKIGAALTGNHHTRGQKRTAGDSRKDECSANRQDSIC